MGGKGLFPLPLITEDAEIFEDMEKELMLKNQKMLRESKKFNC